MDCELWLREVNHFLGFRGLGFIFHSSFWLYQILHFFIFIITAYFLLLHLRSEILLWNRKSSFAKTLAQLNEYSSTFKKSDGLISRSLRLVRDITVIANGHVTVNSRKSIKAHVSVYMFTNKFSKYDGFIIKASSYLMILGWRQQVERCSLRIYFVLDSHRRR